MSDIGWRLILNSKKKPQQKQWVNQYSTCSLIGSFSDFYVYSCDTSKAVLVMTPINYSYYVHSSSFSKLQ